MKKVYLFIIALVFSLVEVKAGYVEKIGGNAVKLTLPDGENFETAEKSLTEEEKGWLREALALKLVGSFTGNDFNKLYDGYNNKVESLDLSDAEIDQWTKPEKWKNTIKSLAFPCNAGYTEIGASFMCDYPELKEVAIPGNIITIGEGAFRGCAKLEKVEFAENGNLETLGGDCFQRTALTEVTIPGTVKHISKGAFDIQNTLKKVVFAEALGDNGESMVNMQIDEQAFMNAKSITDIYIQTRGVLAAANHAFEFDITYGHANSSTKTATLHYPDGMEDIYTNMKHTLDMETAADAGKFHKWLHEHFNQAQDTQVKNGWWEFVNSGSDKEGSTTFVAGKFLKTFSDYHHSYIVPEGIKAYIVNKIEKTNLGYKITLKSLRVIPKQTGVLLYGETNSHTVEGKPVINLTEVEYTGTPLCRENWQLIDGDEYRNYLEPTSTEDGSLLPLAPYELEDGKVVFRNFGFGHFNKTDTGKKYNDEKDKDADFMNFFRLKRGNYPVEKAYLRFAADEYDDSEGSEVMVVKDDHYICSVDENNNHREGYEKDVKGYWRIADWEKDWGNRDSALNGDKVCVKFIGEPAGSGNTTGMTGVVADNDNDDSCYYTMQGVRVSNPTKGIYIKNGKKVLVK